MVVLLQAFGDRVFRDQFDTFEMWFEEFHVYLYACGLFKIILNCFRSFQFRRFTIPMRWRNVVRMTTSFFRGTKPIFEMRAGMR